MIHDDGTDTYENPTGRMRFSPKLFGYQGGFDLDQGELDLLRAHSVGGGEPRTGQLTGMKALMLAVLEDGIRCYLGHSKVIAEEAELWITSPRRNSPFAFVVVCETLGLDPQCVRATAKRMKEQNVSPRQAIPRTRNNVRVPGRVRLRRRTRRPTTGHPQRRAAG